MTGGPRRNGRCRPHEVLTVESRPIDLKSGCCIQDQFLRAAWWCDVALDIDYQEREGDPLVSRLIARDRKTILAKLREVVPWPSRRGIWAGEMEGKWPSDGRR